MLSTWRKRRLKALEKRVVEAAKHACGVFNSYEELNAAEANLISAVKRLKEFERKLTNES